jgi:hypothetical protein
MIANLQEKLDAFMVGDDVKPRCFHCNKTGHIMRDCWELQDEKKEGRDKRDASKRDGRDSSRRDNPKHVSPNTPPRESSTRDEYVLSDTRAVDSSNNVYSALEGDDRAVLVTGFINRKKTNLLIDTGAGPCVIDVGTLRELNIHQHVNTNEAGGHLHGVGDANVIGTIDLEVRLHQHLKRTHKFKVVNDIGGTILLGRSWLSKFDSLKINWKEMTLKIGDILIN